MKSFLMIAMLAAAVWAGAFAAGSDHDTAALAPDFDERPGRSVPRDLLFRDETGAAVRLGGLIDRPTILVFEYYRCEDACGLLSMNLAAALAGTPGEAGKSFRVVTVSFDETEGPDLAREKKRVALAVIGRPIPPEGWRFLTGDRESIRALTEAVGFHFRRQGRTFIHPLGLVFLSPSGKIVRYIRGEQFLPADLAFSLLEASTGTIGPTLSRVARFCFSVDPQGRRLTFRILRVGGAVTLAFAAAVVGLLLLRGRKLKSRGESP